MDSIDLLKKKIGPRFFGEIHKDLEALQKHLDENYKDQGIFIAGEPYYIEGTLIKCVEIADNNMWNEIVVLVN